MLVVPFRGSGIRVRVALTPRAVLDVGFPTGAEGCPNVSPHALDKPLSASRMCLTARTAPGSAPRMARSNLSLQQTGRCLKDPVGVYQPPAQRRAIMVPLSA